MTKQKTKEQSHFETITEIVSIKQIRKEVDVPVPVEKIRSPLDAIELIRYYIGDEDREVFFVVCLSTKNEINAVHRCHVGSINASIVHPREVFKTAILNNSASIIVAHNHPSDNSEPSPEDIEVTKRLIEAGLIIGIEVIDSLIVSQTTYISLREKGYM